MDDFAALLVAIRERAGLTQAQLATAAGLTPSYLSLIENRKKPPPSDAVCERLAGVLGVPARELIEVAHLERAPRTVQQRVRTLSSKLKQERRSTRRVLESLLSPFLDTGLPDFLEGAVEWLGGSVVRRRRLRQILEALGRRHQDRATEVARLLDDLPERDRRLLLELLPKMLGERDRPAAADAARVEPRLFYALPAPDDATRRPFLLLWSGPDSADGDVRDGDLLLVDPGVEPGAGDLVVLRGADGAALLRRLVREGPGFRLARPEVPAARGAPAAGAVPRDATEGEALEAEALRVVLARSAAGTVAEIRRPLRRRGT